MMLKKHKYRNLFKSFTAFDFKNEIRSSSKEEVRVKLYYHLTHFLNEILFLGS